MCGRFALAATKQAISEYFGVLVHDDLPPRYNIAPTQQIVVVAHDGKKLVQWMHWGLIPSWAKDPEIAARTINARAETAAEQPAFREAFRHRRCLIPAEGFYEWKPQARQAKQPYFIHLTESPLMGLAGLWDRWQSPTGEIIESCTVLTTTANDVLRPLHDRMPVILPPEHFDEWLNPSTPLPLIQSLLRPYPAQAMRAYPVGVQVSKPAHEGPDCIAPVRSESESHGELFGSS